MTPRSATPSHLKKRASAWAARVADAVYGAATCGAYGRLQQEAAWLQNASVAAEATLLRLQLEAATTEQAAVEATRAHELRLLELRDQPEARRVLHEERMAAEQTRRGMRLGAGVPTAGRAFIHRCCEQADADRGGGASRGAGAGGAGGEGQGRDAAVKRRLFTAAEL